MKRQGGGDLFGSEGAGVFLFVDKLDLSDPHIVVVEIECLGVIDRMTDFDFVPDIGWRHLIEAAFKADGGIVIDHAFMPDEKDFIQFGCCQSSDGHPVHRRIVAVNGSLADSGMQFVVVVLLKPQPEGLVDVLKADCLMHAAKKTFPDGSKQPFYLSFFM